MHLLFDDTLAIVNVAMEASQSNTGGERRDQLELTSVWYA